MTADIPGLLIGVDNDVREIGYKLYKWIGDPNRMQYPNAARFAKIPAEVFTVCKLTEACRDEHDDGVPFFSSS